MPSNEVKMVFKLTTPADLDLFQLISQKKNSLNISEDLLVEHRVKSIYFFYEHYGFLPPINLTVHPEAFRNSRYFTNKIRFNGFDISHFYFLASFNELQELEIEHSLSVNLRTLPLLPSLKALIIKECSGLIIQPNTDDFPLLARGLEIVVLRGNSLNDGDCERILDWILSGASSETLIHLDLTTNRLTRIPRQLKYFQRLEYIRFCGNEFGRGSLSTLFFPKSVQFLDLQLCSIAEIQPGAWNGKVYYQVEFSLYILK